MFGGKELRLAEKKRKASEKELMLHSRKYDDAVESALSLLDDVISLLETISGLPEDKQEKLFDLSNSRMRIIESRIASDCKDRKKLSCRGFLSAIKGIKRPAECSRKERKLERINETEAGLSEKAQKVKADTEKITSCCRRLKKDYAGCGRFKDADYEKRGALFRYKIHRMVKDARRLIKEID